MVSYSPYLNQNYYTQDYYIKRDRKPEERNEDSNRRNSWGEAGVQNLVDRSGVGEQRASEENQSSSVRNRVEREQREGEIGSTEGEERENREADDVASNSDRERVDTERIGTGVISGTQEETGRETRNTGQNREEDVRETGPEERNLDRGHEQGENDMNRRD